MVDFRDKRGSKQASENSLDNNVSNSKSTRSSRTSGGFFYKNVVSDDINFSASAMRLLGFRSGDKVTTGDLLAKLNDRDQQKMTDLIDQVIERGSSGETTIELPVRNSQQEVAQIFVTAEPLRKDALGKTLEIVGSMAAQFEEEAIPADNTNLLSLAEQITEQIFTSNTSLNLRFGELIGASYLCCFKLTGQMLTPIGEWRGNTSDAFIALPQPIAVTDDIKTLLNEPAAIYHGGSSKLDTLLSTLWGDSHFECAVVCPIIQDAELLGVLFFGGQEPAALSRSQLGTLIGLSANALAERLANLARNRQKDARIEQYDAALRASKMGIWEVDFGNNTAKLTSSVVELLNHRFDINETNAYKILETHVSEEYMPRARAVTRDAIESGAKTLNFEFPYYGANGENRWMKSHCIFYDSDQPGVPSTRCLSIYTDITDIKNTEKDLTIARVNEHAANGIKNEFLARMSHELRTPINAILGMSGLLQQEGLSKSQEEKIREIEQASSSLLNIVDDILDFSSIATGNHTVANINFDTDKLFNDLSSQFATAVQIKKLDLDFDISSDIPKFLIGDPERLQQALKILLDNAIKFTHSGRVSLKVTPTSHTKNRINIRFEITDTGIGINSDALGKLFQPFQQLEQFTTRHHQGNGLGLAICQSIVKDMHGHLRAESELGKGSTFTCDIPLTISPVGIQDLRYKAVDYNSIKVLVLDPDPQSMAVIERIIQSMNIEAVYTETLTQAQQAKERNSQTPFELLICSESHRTELATEVDGLVSAPKNLSSKPRVMVLSHRAEKDFKTTLESFHYDEYVTKPFTPSKLFDGLLNIFGESLLSGFDPSLPLSIDEKELETLKGAKILLAEDNIVNQKVAVGILKKKGVEVTVADNGRLAIEHLNQHPLGYFSAILMDIDMPEMNGLEATEAIRNGIHDAQIPIIAMTAHALEGDRERCLASGMNDYVMKPVKPEKLYTTITWHILHSQTTL